MPSGCTSSSCRWRARWSPPSERSAPLSAYAREAEAHSLELFDAALDGTAREPGPQVRGRLLEAAASDVVELLPQLQERAGTLAGDAERRLAERGERENRELSQTLHAQRDRVRGELERHSAQYAQLTLGFADDERRQLEQNMKAWERRLEQFERDLVSEPERLAEFYVVHARRVEPVGLVYLWPDTN